MLQLVFCVLLSAPGCSSRADGRALGPDGPLRAARAAAGVLGRVAASARSCACALEFPDGLYGEGEAAPLEPYDGVSLASWRGARRLRARCWRDRADRRRARRLRGRARSPAGAGGDRPRAVGPRLAPHAGRRWRKLIHPLAAGEVARQRDDRRRGPRRRRRGRRRGGPRRLPLREGQGRDRRRRGPARRRARRRRAGGRDPRRRQRRLGVARGGAGEPARARAGRPRARARSRSTASRRCARSRPESPVRDRDGRDARARRPAPPSSCA